VLSSTILDDEQWLTLADDGLEGVEMDGATAVGRPDSETVLNVARWRGAQGQLFAGLLHYPERYERCIALMAVLIEDLDKHCPTKELTLHVDPGVFAAKVAADSGIDLAGLDLDMVGAAALANHWWRLDPAEGQKAPDDPTETSQNGQR
jgi:hypothetical protein